MKCLAAVRFRHSNIDLHLPSVVPVADASFFFDQRLTRLMNVHRLKNRILDMTAYVLYEDFKH